MSITGDIARDLASHAEAFCRTWFPNGRKIGNYWQMGDVTGAAGRSLTIRLNPSYGRPAGKWCDWATNEYGDLLDLLEVQVNPTSHRELLNKARHFLRRPEVHGQQAQSFISRNRTSDRIEAGRKLFGFGRPLKGTSAKRYLGTRGIHRFGPALRFHPTVFSRDRSGALCKGPALLAAITDNTGAVTGCSRSWLNTSGDSLAAIEEPKRVLGRLYGNAIRFYGACGCDDLIVGEGLENVLSIGTAFPLLPLASCLTAMHLGLFVPPPWCKRLWIARDNDDAGQEAAYRLRVRAQECGIEAFDLVPRLEDFNDDLLSYGLLALRCHVTEQMRSYTGQLAA